LFSSEGINNLTADPKVLSGLKNDLEEGNEGKQQGRRIHEVTDAYSSNTFKQSNPEFSKLRAKSADQAGRSGHETMRRDHPKVGRNDPCPCGSGKKYKNCCGRK
jgi:preprotein translocase subunit SecA